MNGVQHGQRLRVLIGRRMGASPPALQRMRDADAKEAWFGRCRHCGEPLKGDLVLMADHECKVTDDGNQASENPKPPYSGC